MTTHLPPTSLMAALDVLGNVLTQTSDSYQRLLDKPKSIHLYREAGLSLRYLSGRYAKVLLTALSQIPPADDDQRDWDNSDGHYFDEGADN